MRGSTIGFVGNPMVEAGSISRCGAGPRRRARDSPLKPSSNESFYAFGVALSGSRERLPKTGVTRTLPSSERWRGIETSRQIAVRLRSDRGDDPRPGGTTARRVTHACGSAGRVPLPRGGGRTAGRAAAARPAGCVPRARVVVSAAPGLAETLAAGWRKATQFYARFGITERRLVREVDPGGFRGASLTESGWLPTHALIEASEHAPSVLPMSETA